MVLSGFIQDLLRAVLAAAFDFTIGRNLLEPGTPDTPVVFNAADAIQTFFEESSIVPESESHISQFGIILY